MNGEQQRRAEADEDRDRDARLLAATATTATAQPDTFDRRFSAMRADLRSILTRMVADESNECAQDALGAIRALDKLRHTVRGYFGDDLEWSWQPTPPEDD